MASRRRVQREDPSTPAQQDEADILAEVGAVHDDERGEMVADEEKILELGAVDAESVIENRRLDAIAGKKRANIKGSSFNTGNVITTYDAVLQSWPANTLDIHVKRLTGAPVEEILTSRPRSGTELFGVLKALHGQYEEAQYEVRFKDNSTHRFRGNGRITMPDTRNVPPPQQGQPMVYPPGYPPGYPPQQVPQQPAPQVPPTVQVMPSSFDPHSMMSMMGQMFEMFRQMQVPPSPPPPVHQPAPPAFQVPQQMPPMPSPQASPAEMMAWMQQAFGMFQQLQAPQQQQPAHVVPQLQPVVVPMPAQQAPPPPQSGGIAETLMLMEQMFKMFQRMQGPSADPRGPRPPYYPQGDRDPNGPRPPYYPQGGGQERAPYQPPQRQPTPAEQFREMVTVVRTAASAMQEIDSLLPRRQEAVVEATSDDDDSPVRIIDTGPIKIAINKDDGALRWADTGMMALPGMLKWVGEQREAIQKGAADRQTRQQPPTQQLPPGYVEVGPGYQPPPGFVAIPIDPPPQQQSFPPPPVQVPPTIQETPAPPPGRRTWAAPTFPPEEGEGQ